MVGTLGSSSWVTSARRNYHQLLFHLLERVSPPLRVVALAHPGVVLAEVLSAKMSVLIPFERQELTLDPE